MSKQVKQMEMEALRQTFRDVRELVLLSVSGKLLPDTYAAKTSTTGLRSTIPSFRMTELIMM